MAPEASPIGTPADLWPLQAKDWLQDAEDRCHLRPCQGRWEADLCFLSGPAPLTWRFRRLGSSPTQTKARQAARLQKRSVGKDPRDTQKTRTDGLDFCAN
ncbi:MAG: hypothetical protein D6722_23060 [Bacteroidetes bacterium]|nr:MAG: hypothetical protein D6722_23060 [Bacteroidota bacterium]